MMVKLFLTLTVLVQPAFADRGGQVPNGGDTVMCTPTAGSPYKGYYSLDYLLTLREDNSDLVTIRSWDEAKHRLLNLFDEKYPDMARLFRDYLSRIPGEDVTLPQRQYMEQRLWLEAPYGLLDIKDERMVRKLPPNCYKLRAPDEIDVIQTVIRRTNDDAIVYHYDPSILRALKADAPQQYSFLMVHEWLWDYIHDAEVIRGVNRFLHTNAVERLNAEELKLSLRNLGFSLRFARPMGFCQRSEQVRSYIERVQQKPCTQIDEYREIGGSSSLQLASAGITTIKPGDFSGLGIVTTIDLSDNQLEYLFEDMFAGTPNALQVLLNGNGLKQIPKNLFIHTPSLRDLQLENNQLSDFPRGFFQNLKRSITINLKRNGIAKISEEMVRELCSLPRTIGVNLNMTQNPVKKADLPALYWGNCSGREPGHGGNIRIFTDDNFD